MNNSSSDPKGAKRRSDQTDEPVDVQPVDFGPHRKAILRSLELNRQLLYTSDPEFQVNEEAFRHKIDELLDRLHGLLS